MSSLIYRSFVLLLALSLSACGFQLRGAGGSMSLASLSPLFIRGLSTADPFYQVLRSNLRGADAEIVQDRAAARETLIIYNHKRDKKIHSVGARGRVLEYELIESLSFTLGSMPSRFERERAKVLSVRRIYTNPETETLGRQYEETELRRDMYQQLSTQLLRRISAKARGR